ncbi:3-isopropylmalate dehydrogenase [Lignipirellula cremea]|uniref:3-isopropylmalate dehydrogenase n=1 Tax=Lignipirellula cremea TaxID=2528010 RepID=A0A518E1B8_9BACT|nr:3-isopropylmalate dehydrogenase [Lignipirellula cremea]QDU97896.1 D-malate dehydrogenase [decarboxylating] [Lignipirellula cremea]
MTTYQIAIFPGDGIGIEVTEQAVRVLEELEQHAAYSWAWNYLPWGAEHHRQTGQVAPSDFLEVLRPVDAILLGAVGWPETLPDHVTLEPLVRIRQAFDQYACVRPARLFPGVKSVLAGKGPEDIDLVVVRENSEGEYVNNGGRFKQGQPDEVALQTAVHTRRGVERIMRYGFELARRRRHRLTMITKSNAMRYSYVLWDDILDELAPQYADVETDRQHCDAAVMNFVRRPEHFDVVVASNLFGDLLTDLGGIISGGLGLAPSTNTNPERTYPSMFEPVHGSAPDIAGQGIANPIAAILSAALMLDHLGEAADAERIRTAVARTLSDGAQTPDLGGSLTTEQMGTEVIRRLQE